MINVIWSRFILLFHLICWIATLATVTYCIHVFSRNEDLCIVDYKTYYETEHDIYPRLSLCLKNPFSETKLRMHGTKFRKENYTNFLLGNYFDSQMLDMKYEDLILDLSEEVVEYGFTWSNGSYIPQSVVNITTKLFKSTHGVSWRNGFYQCYELQIPHDKRIRKALVLFKSSLFTSRNKNDGIKAFLHHQNHLLISGKNAKVIWSPHSFSDNYEMRFRIDSVEVLNRRNKHGRHCDELENYDDRIVANMIKSVGCRAPYHKNVTGVELCNTPKEMKNVCWDIKKDREITPPCRTMEKIIYVYEEYASENKPYFRKEHFWIGIHFRDKQFKEIVQTRYSQFFYYSYSDVTRSFVL
jgi:hypothetical protein